GMDSSVFTACSNKLAFTTDSYVVSPLFFKGGDIGKLAVYGTVNDLSVSGAKPLYLSCGFILEEGLSIDILKRIVISMSDACQKANVKIITGDTKVVEKGCVDKIYINTSGVGSFENEFSQKDIQCGDKIIVTGAIAEHGTVILLERYGIDINGNFKSDCNPLNHIVEKISEYSNDIKLMKDCTRGGLATALHEISDRTGLGIEIKEECIPVRREVRAVNDIFGLDPMYLACEGRMLIVVSEGKADEILNKIIQMEDCNDANIIGSFVADYSKVVYM
ncbi:hypothetical protein DU75_05765, partial [Methanosarcina mazei]